MRKGIHAAACLLYGAAAQGATQTVVVGLADLSLEHELDVLARHYASRPDPHVPRYTALDVRLAWRAGRDVEVALLAQNLNEQRHPEWGPAFNRAELERALYLALRLGI